MRTVNKVGGANGTVFTEFYGNATDVKPTENVPNGSAFYEVDNNMQEYRFDKENKIWYPITRGGTAPSDEYLPLSGGIMTGDINMNGNSLLNAKSITLKDETGEYTVELNLVHLETTNPETGEPFSYEAIEFSDSDDTSKQYVITGVADPLLDTDAANKAYVDQETAKYLPLTGGKMFGNIDLNNKSIYGIRDLTFISDVQLKAGVDNNRIYLQVVVRGTDNKLSVKAADAVKDDELVTKSQMETADSKYLPLTGTTEDNPVTGVVTFNGESTITGVSTPVNDTDVVTKKYADDIKTELDDKTNQLNEDLSDLSSNINAIRFMSKSVKRFTTCCACFEKYLYIFYNNANGSFCDKYDVSIDYIPNLVNTLKLTDENLACSDAKIANDYLYVTLRDGQGGTNTTDGKTLGELHIISLNSFQNVKTLTMNWKCTALTIHKDYLLISMQLAGYDLYDLTNPIEPTLTYSFRPEIGSVEYQECAFFERDNKTYFIDAGFGFGFYIWDVTSKTSPVRVGTFMFSQAWNNGDNLHLHTEGIVIDGNMVYATLSVSEKYIDTEYDKRGIIKFDISNLDVFNYEHMNEIPYEHILINKTDYSPFYGDYDVKPTRIVKVGNALVTNSGAKGLTCFKIDKNSVKYNGLISVSDTSFIDRICITSDGRIFGTNAYNTKLSGKDMVMIRLVNVNFN